MRTHLFRASILLFLISLALPVMTLQDIREPGNGETWLGWGALMQGWMGPSVNQYSWYANVFWLAGSLFLIRPIGKLPAILPGIAVLLALHMFTLPGTVIAGLRPQTAALREGAYVWLSAIVLQALASTLPDQRDRLRLYEQQP